MASKLTGDRELIATLRGIDVGTSASLDRIGREALEPTRKLTADNARRLRLPGKAPAGGHLDQGVVVRKTGGRGRVWRQFWVSLTRRARSIGHMVEFGTAPHPQPLRRVFHPGARAKPYMTPAFEATKSGIGTILAKGTWAAIVGSIRFGGRRR